MYFQKGLVFLVIFHQQCLRKLSTVNQGEWSLPINLSLFLDRDSFCTSSCLATCLHCQWYFFTKSSSPDPVKFYPIKLATGGEGLGFRIYVFEPLAPPGIFHFFTLPLEIPDKAKLNPWKFHIIFSLFTHKFHPLRFLLTPAGNSTDMVFLWYPWKFHILNPPPLFWFFDH